MTASFFDTPLAQEKREIVKNGVVYQFSFAYEVEEAGLVTLEDGTKANELQKLDLFEISVVPIPANPRAEVTEVKAGDAELKEKATEPEQAEEKSAESEPEAKSGRRNSRKDADAIREAITLLEGVLGEYEDTEAETNEEDEAKANEASEEPEQSNSRKAALLDVITKIKEEA
jgi:DNA polymerase sigma